MSGHGFVGDLLLRRGVVDAPALQRACELQATQPMTLGRALQHLGIADEAAISRAIAESLHLEYVDDELTQSADAAGLLPADFCRKRRVVPLATVGHSIRV